ncbi:ester cyclase [Roseobacter litoralis]|uniref:ester cyclase n=1 Tax=Roseobacter litoralis TaxID=42443 RepID=UPI00249567BB|nr:ester cyclase [Roseobacter litoralis]
MNAMIPETGPDLTPIKAVSQAYAAALERATPDTVADILATYQSDRCQWFGMHPFHEQTGPRDIAKTFWAPFLTSFSRMQRREDIFFAGLNEIDGFSSTWTTSMGHFLGLFDAPFLGIPATGKIAMLRYAEFNRVENGKITQSALFVDLLHLMAQAGIHPLNAPQTGAQLVQPGPRTHDGLLMTPQPHAASQETLSRINNMIGSIDHANAAAKPPTPQEELRVDWQDDMIWWGPTGIGATYTIDRYIDQHQGPFRRAMEGRVLNGHLCRMAEGTYGGFFGWPNLTLTNRNGFMGVPGNDIRADMRVVDIYRRDGNKLVENWVFIDMLHFLKMQGVDVLAQITAQSV